MSATTDLSSISTEAQQREGAGDSAIPRLARVMSWAVAAVGVAALTFYMAVAMTVAIPIEVAYRSAGAVAATAALVATNAGVALLLTLRRPDQRIGWYFSVASLLVSTHAAAAAYVYLSRHRGVAGLMPGSEVAAWLSTVASVPAFSLMMILIILVFPTGHLRSRRWAVAAAAALVGAMALVLYFTWRPGRMIFYPGILNPFGIDGLVASSLLQVLYVASVVLICGAAAGGAYCMFDRYRDADSIERQQLKWVAYAAAVSTLAAGLFFTKINFTLPQDSTEELTLVATLIGAGLVPIAAAIACFRYHLYDIDIIINRTVAWAALTAILGGLYAAFLLLFQRIFVAVTGDRSDAAIIITTLLVAGLFSPLKKVLEGGVDRRFKTSTTSHTPAAAAAPAIVITPEIEALVARVSESVSERVTERVARRVVAEELARLGTATAERE